MQDHLSNRMQEPSRNRGRPSKMLTPPPEAPQPAENVEFPQPPKVGVRCPSCGRSTPLRRDRVERGTCYANCTLCPARLVLTFDDTRYLTVRVIQQ